MLCYRGSPEAEQLIIHAPDQQTCCKSACLQHIEASTGCLHGMWPLLECSNNAKIACSLQGRRDVHACCGLERGA